MSLGSQQKVIRSSLTLFTLSLLLTLNIVSSYNMFGTNMAEKPTIPNGPKVRFPDTFEIGMSTNDPGLNVTEVIYYDKNEKKIRLQIFYSILGLEASKGLDIVLDESQKMVAVQTDVDCKKTLFSDSLLPLQLFFSMFDSLTDYKGMEDDLHVFKVKQFDETVDLAPKFYFLFDENMNFKKSRVEQYHVGQYDFEAVVPLKGRTFEAKDWYQAECKQIEENILKEGNGFVTFMQQLVKHLIGNEDDILRFLGYDPNAKKATPSDEEESDDFEQ